MEQWYTFHTKPNAEYQVITVLQQRKIQTYLPEIEVRKVDKKHIKKPFFPCYMFAKIDFEIVGLSSVQWTPGLRRVVSVDDKPVPLTDELINMIRYKLGELETSNKQPTHSFKLGDIVRITAGPFQDMLAVFDGSTTPNQRVQVLLDILGHASRVQVDVTNLEKASSETETPLSKRPRRTRGRGRRIKKVSQ